ncbi:MAG: AidA/PixA family protein [Sediminibacterium sp.]|nr:AidA/PixA family protein [Sediminibacterium sp.]
MKRQTVSQINIFVFTAALMKDFPLPSKDQNNPTLIPTNSDYFFLVRTDNHFPIFGATLATTAILPATEHLQFFIMSPNNNYETPVILYDLSTQNKTDRNALKLHYYNAKETIIPEVFNPLQTTIRERPFWFSTTTLHAGKMCRYNFRIAIYDDDFNLFGYFQFTFNPVYPQKDTTIFEIV